MPEKNGTKLEQPETIQREDVRTIRIGNLNLDRANQQESSIMHKTTSSVSQHIITLSGSPSRPHEATNSTKMHHATKGITTRNAHQTPGISNNVLAASELADAGCELIFYKQAAKSYTIEKSSFKDPTTYVWQVSLVPDGIHSIFPPHTNLNDLHKTPENSHTNSIYQPIYKCSNTKNLISFYYATMGYLVISTWCKGINKGYFQGWNGLTSDRVQKFITL
ncbi:LOW QUALITY PROTEIN: hypothetical protein ACHAW6_006077 [Cyclotella cf. meneghiniana]